MTHTIQLRELSDIDLVRTRRHIVVVAVIVIAAALLTFSDDLHDGVQRLLAFASSAISEHPYLGKAVFIVWSVASAAVAFVSSAVLVPVAVYAWGARTTVVLLWLSWLCGGVLTYTVGRTLGRRVASWLVARERVEYYSERISSAAGFLTILLFQLALPSEVPGYVLGAVRYRFLIYLAALAVAELPFAIGAVYLSEGFIERDYATLIGIGLAGLALSIAAFRLFHQRLQRPPA